VGAEMSGSTLHGPAARYAVQPVTFGDAQALLASGHYLRHLRKSGTQIGLVGPAGLVGVAVFGQPSREGVVRALWDQDQGTLRNTVELLRFYTVDGIEEWAGTWFLSRAIRLLPPTIEMIVAFSDPQYGHHGGLYQAASWIYTGTTTNTPYHYEDPDGNRIGKQTPWKQARREGLLPGERAVDGERRYARERQWRRVVDQPKHRYVYPRSRRARRLLRHPVRPYPKPSRVGDLVIPKHPPAPPTPAEALVILRREWVAADPDERKVIPEQAAAVKVIVNIMGD